jgi:hypothetical protein
LLSVRVETRGSSLLAASEKGGFPSTSILTSQPYRERFRALFCEGHETVLYTFTGGADGGNPARVGARQMHVAYLVLEIGDTISL